MVNDDDNGTLIVRSPVVQESGKDISVLVVREEERRVEDVRLPLLLVVVLLRGMGLYTIDDDDEEEG